MTILTFSEVLVYVGTCLGAGGKRIVLIIGILLFSVPSVAQVRDSILSRRFELKGWESYFEGDFDRARAQFARAREYDLGNILAAIGLMTTTPEGELKPEEVNFLKEIGEDTNEYLPYSTIALYLMVNNEIMKGASSLPAPDYRQKYDEEYIQFRAALTDSEFTVFNENHSPRIQGAFKNRMPSGTWSYCDEDGRLIRTITYPEAGETVVVSYYKEDGEKTREEWIKGMPSSDGTKIKEVIYWQKNPGKHPEYLFVSHSGFTVYDSERMVRLDESTPDNVIEEVYNPENKSVESFIWKGGQRYPYRYCAEDGEISSQYFNHVLMLFRWENCEKILILE